MIKTYLVPITDELIKAMEKGEAPSFLHCATCLDGLTNGEVIQKMFPNNRVDIVMGEVYFYTHVDEDEDFDKYVIFDLEWWNRKWGE